MIFLKARSTKPQIDKSVTYLARSPPISPVLKIFNKINVLVFSIIQSPSIYLLRIFCSCVYNPCMRKSIPSSITKKKKVYDSFCTEQIGCGRKIRHSVANFCVSMMITSEMYNFPIFNQLLLKISLVYLIFCLHFTQDIIWVYFPFNRDKRKNIRRYTFTKSRE